MATDGLGLLARIGHGTPRAGRGTQRRARTSAVERGDPRSEKLNFQQPSSPAPSEAFINSVEKELADGRRGYVPAAQPTPVPLEQESLLQQD